MRLFLILLLTLLNFNVFAPPSSTPIEVTEEDGNPSVYPWKIKVPNNSLTENVDGSASLNYLISYSETDPLFSAWQTSYDNHVNWDIAYSCGNHAGLYLPIAGKAADSDLLDGHDTAYFQTALTG